MKSSLRKVIINLRRNKRIQITQSELIIRDLGTFPRIYN